MAEAFIGLNVNITLADGTSVIGPVAELADDGSFIILRGSIQRNGKLLKVRELQLQASDIKGLKAVKPEDAQAPPAAHHYGMPPPPPPPPHQHLPHPHIPMPPPTAPYPPYPAAGHHPPHQYIAPPPLPSQYYLPHQHAHIQPPPQQRSMSPPRKSGKTAFYSSGKISPAPNATPGKQGRGNSSTPKRNVAVNTTKSARGDKNKCFGADVDSGLDEFDFEANLNKFDKAAVFAEIEQASGIDPSVLLHTHNVVKKYRHYENILEPSAEAVAEIDAYSSPAVSRVSAHTPKVSHFKTEYGIVVPHVTKAEMNAIAAEMVKMGIRRDCTIENAAHSVAGMALQLLGGARRINPRNTHQTAVVVVLAGQGFKGAVAMAIARHLAGHNVSVVLCCTVPPSQLDKEQSHQYQLFTYTGGKYVADASELPQPMSDPVDLIIDGLWDDLLLDHTPPDSISSHMVWVANNPANVLSLNGPSGICYDTATEYVTDCISPKWTVCLGLPSAGLQYAQDMGSTSILYLADIGIAREALVRMGLRYYPPFGDKYVIPLTLEVD